MIEVSLGAQGRLVIPSVLRRALNLQPGDTLIARLDDDRLVLEKAETVKRRLRARFADLRGKASLADELVAERRAEAEREP